MAINKIEEIQMSFVKRPVSKYGDLKSDTWNDTQNELSQDIAEIINQWNTKLLPLFDLLPDGSITEEVDSWNNGLDGKTLYVNADCSSSSTIYPDYYNSSSIRPNTIFEQFQNMYTYVESTLSTIENNLTNLTISAKDMPIVDTNEIITSTNVEDALQELAAAASYVSDHSGLSNLENNDHPQYLLRDGSNAMEEDLNMGTFSIIGASDITMTGLLSGGVNNNLVNIETIEVVDPTISSNPGSTTYEVEIASAVFDLPVSATIGTELTFIANHAHGEAGTGVMIYPNGRNIKINEDETDDLPLSYVESGSSGSVIRLLLVNATTWIATSVVGDWSITS